MKIIRTLSVAIALLTPLAAFASSGALRASCCSGSCCPGCPLCNHAG